MEEKDELLIEHEHDTPWETCPNCSSESIVEVSGWCYTHNAPVINEDNVFCPDSNIVNCQILPVEEAYYCHECSMLYDTDIMLDWNCAAGMYEACPVGMTCGELSEFNDMHEFDE